MKILRFIYAGKENYGIVDNNKIHILENSPFYSEIKKTGEIISFQDIEKFLPPCNPPNIIALGLNYKKHAEESKMAVPDEPVIFLKATTSLNSHLSPIILPSVAPDEVDYEAELVIVIGKKCKNVSEKEAKRYILGYTCGNDITARDCQLKKDKQWARAKSFDTFCPVGPWIETELTPTDLKIISKLNGKIMQNSSTSDMIFNAFQIVSYLSYQMTLLPETIILTGTPEGVGFTKNPPVFLKEGDTVEICIEGIGTLTNPIRSDPGNG